MRALAVCFKEWRLLARDLPGVAMLYAMPAVLVVVICLVQQNVLDTLGSSSISILYLDQDRGECGGRLLELLKEDSSLQIKVQNPATPPSDAKKLIMAGKYHCLILVPGNCSNTLKAMDEGAKSRVRVIFDPTIQGGLRAGITGMVKRATALLEARAARAKAANDIASKLSSLLPPGMIDGDQLRQELKLRMERLFTREAVTVESSTVSRDGLSPNPTQQNVPAWALFGMFFVALPIAGTIMEEKEHGTLCRLLTTPVKAWEVIGGKIFAFTTVCVTQFLFIMTLGLFLLPGLGAPELTLGTSPQALILAMTTSAIAAASFGVLLGLWAGSYGQAVMVGAISIVVSAALGGIMVPVYVMPDTMRTISHISPLGWGLNAFLDIFVREGGVEDTIPELFSLLAFSIVCILVSLAIFRRAARGRMG